MPPGKFSVNGTTGDVLTIPAPVAPSFIRVLSLNLYVSAASTVTFTSKPAGTGTEIGAALLGTGNAYERTDEVSGILDCLPGQAFVINNSAGTIRGNIVFAVMGCVPAGPLGGAAY